MMHGQKNIKLLEKCLTTLAGATWYDRDTWTLA